MKNDEYDFIDKRLNECLREVLRNRAPRGEDLTQYENTTDTAINLYIRLFCREDIINNYRLNLLLRIRGVSVENIDGNDYGMNVYFLLMSMENYLERYQSYIDIKQYLENYLFEENYSTVKDSVDDIIKESARMIKMTEDLNETYTNAINRYNELIRIYELAELSDEVREWWDNATERDLMGTASIAADNTEHIETAPDERQLLYWLGNIRGRGIINVINRAYEIYNECQDLMNNGP
jgi:hypothetical protein